MFQSFQCLKLCVKTGAASIMQEMVTNSYVLYYTSTDFDMLVSPVDEPLINLITEAQRVMFNTEVSDHLQLISGENLQEDDRNYWKHLFFSVKSASVHISQTWWVLADAYSPSQ